MTSTRTSRARLCAPRGTASRACRGCGYSRFCPPAQQRLASTSASRRRSATSERSCASTTWSSAPTAPTPPSATPSRPSWGRPSTCGPTASSGSAPRSRSRPSPSTSRRTTPGSGACTRTATRRGCRRSSSNARPRPSRAPGWRPRTRTRPSPTASGSSRNELAGHRLLKNRSHLAPLPHGQDCALAPSEPGAGRRRGPHRALLHRLRNQARHGGRDRARSSARETIRMCRSRCGATRPTGAPSVDSLQRAAQVSLEWFENTERYLALSPLQFTFSLLTRSLRVTHDNLRVRDPALVEPRRRRVRNRAPAAAPPMFTPFQLREMRLENRSSSHRCASTRPRTGRSATGTWCTWGAARSAAPGWSWPR